jgi:hypothetical protein
VNIRSSVPSLIMLVFLTLSLAHILISRMVLLSVSTDKLLESALLSLLTLQCHSNFGMRYFSLLRFLLIVFLLRFLLIPLLLRSYLTPNQSILSFVLLVPPVGPTCDLITPTNLPFAPSNVPFSGTTLIIRATSALTYPLVVCIFSTTWCLMRVFFLLPGCMLMSVLDFAQKFPCFLLPFLIPHRLGVGLWTLIICLSLLILLCSHVLHRILQGRRIPWIS